MDLRTVTRWFCDSLLRAGMGTFSGTNVAEDGAAQTQSMLVVPIFSGALHAFGAGVRALQEFSNGVTIRVKIRGRLDFTFHFASS